MSNEPIFQALARETLLRDKHGSEPLNLYLLDAVMPPRVEVTVVDTADGPDTIPLAVVEA